MTEDEIVPLANPGVVFTEEKPGLVYIHFTHYSADPEVNTAQAQYYLAEIKAALIRNADKLTDFIIDTSAVSLKVRSLSQQARQAYTEAYGQAGVGKVAMVGMNKWLKTMILMMAQITGRSSQTAFFATKAEALIWISKSST